MWAVMRRAAVVLSVACVAGVACGDGPATRPPDAGITEELPDAQTELAACREFTGPATTVPAHVVGTLARPDIQSPQCASVDAPYGIESSGADSVIALEGLAPGTAYIVELRSASDLAFYVATGCSTASGPDASECALFVDATATGGELGRFVATSPSAYVIVDHYASATPANVGFTLDVYAEACVRDAECTSGLPVCSNGRCVQCADGFDCTNSDAPRCDVTSHACVAGIDSCTNEDVSEPEDDGPSGAYLFAPNPAGFASTTSEICSAPRSESDFYAFEVTSVGDTWDITLEWTGARDLNLELFDADGTRLGMSYWEQPETVRLRYLPVGMYHFAVTDVAANATPVPYTVSVQRTTGAGCTSRQDCGSEYRNQLFRGDCVAGACVALAGAGAVPGGGACDSVSDCAAGLSCPSFFFVADADTRAVCAPTCGTTADCTALGADYVCTGYLIANICVQTCTSDDQCPTDVDSQPTLGPWYRLRCHQASGRCVL